MIFEHFTGDEEEILKGQKYTAYYKFDYKTRKPVNLLQYLFQPDTSFFLGLTYIDVSIDHYIYTANTDQISERDFGSAALFGPKIGFLFDFIRDPYPIFIKLLVDAEYTPIGNLDYTDKFDINLFLIKIEYITILICFLVFVFK